MKSNRIAVVREPRKGVPEHCRAALKEVQTTLRSNGYEVTAGETLTALDVFNLSVKGSPQVFFYAGGKAHDMLCALAFAHESGARVRYYHPEERWRPVFPLDDYLLAAARAQTRLPFLAEMTDGESIVAIDLKADPGTTLPPSTY